ncbi:PilZ domain-containing protein [Stenotrophomonas rhizophila]|nr:PilZ domain-containing protein [Stenotrophomonas rhizophila]
MTPVRLRVAAPAAPAEREGPHPRSIPAGAEQTPRPAQRRCRANPARRNRPTTTGDHLRRGHRVRATAADRPGTRVKVKMVLMPRAHGLLLRGKVTHCDRRPDGDFEVGTEFTDMTDAQRQLLARYILQRQQQQRRQQLEQDGPAS